MPAPRVPTGLRNNTNHTDVYGGIISSYRSVVRLNGNIIEPSGRRKSQILPIFSMGDKVTGRVRQAHLVVSDAPHPQPHLCTNKAGEIALQTGTQ